MMSWPAGGSGLECGIPGAGSGGRRKLRACSVGHFSDRSGLCFGRWPGEGLVDTASDDVPGNL